MPLIDRTAKASLDTNLNNGVTSDAPVLKASNDKVYDNQDANYTEFTTHRDTATLAHPDGSVTTAKLANGLVTNAKLANGAVTNDKVADGTLTSAKFVAGAISNETQNGLSITGLRTDVTQNTSDIADLQTDVGTLQTDVAAKADQADLDTTNTTVTAKADKTYVDMKVASVTSGSPKGVYATVTALTTAFPTGNTNIYVVTDDGHWYYWNGSAWVSGGTYQSSPIIADDSLGTQTALSSKIATDIIYGNLSKVYGFTGTDATYASPTITRINGQQIIENLLVTQISLYVDSNGAFKILELTRNADGTFNFKKVLFSGSAVTGANAFTVNETVSKGSYLAYYSAAVAISYNASGTGYSYSGELTGSNVTVSEGNLSFNFAITGTTLGIQNIDDSIPDGSITEKMVDHTSKIALKKNTGRNLFDKSKTTSNHFIVYTTGELSGYNSSFKASDYIELIPGKKYVMSGTNEQMAFYDSDKVYVSGVVSINIPFNNVPIPDGVKYGRFSVGVSEVDSVVLINVDDSNYGEYNSTYNTYSEGIVADAVRNYRNISVNPDGTGDYTTITNANAACTDGSKNKVYNLYIHPGTYQEKNIALNDYVNLIGLDRNSCIIQGWQSDSETPSNIELNSTLDLSKTNELSNLTITCQNMRYPIHDDGGNVDIVRKMTNCHVEHLGNDGARAAQPSATIWDSECAYGGGVRSGNVAYFKNCTFKSNFIPWSVHNNVTFTKPCYIELENCGFTLGTSPLANFAIRVQSDGSLTQDRINFIGCRANAPLLLQDNWLGAANADHIDWIVEGYGNDIPFASEYTTGQMDVTRFNDEIRTAKATVAITQGQFCCWDTKIGQVRVMTTSDDVSLFAGIAIETVSSGSLVTLKYKGYMYKKWITSAANSDIGVFFGVGTDGKIASVTTDKAILVGMGASTLVFKFI